MNSSVVTDNSIVLENLKTDEMIEFIQALVRINSVYDPEVENANEEEVAQYI